MTFWESATILAWVAIAFLGCAMYGLARQLSVVQQRQLSGGSVRSAPSLSLPDSLLRSFPGSFLGLFIEPSCLSCSDRLRDLASLPPRALQDVDVVLFVERSGADQIDVPRLAQLIPIEQTLGALGVPATPYGVVVEDGAILESSPVGSMAALVRLLEVARAAPTKRGTSLANEERG